MLKLAGLVETMVLFASHAAAQPDRASLVKQLDSLAGSGVVENRTAGLVATVVRGTDTLLLKSYGRADVEWNRT